MPGDDDLKRYRANLEAEINGVLLYSAMADAERQPQLAELYRRLAAIEAKHARFWEDKIGQLDRGASPWKPALRTRLMIWLAKRLGPKLVLPLVAASEREGQRMYDAQPEAAKTAMPKEERSHARLLSRVLEAAGGARGSTVARLERRHRGGSGNALRAAVLGSADGLVSNLSLVMGVAGAQATGHQIVVAGTAGLMAGACSMAIGEWVSVESSRELNQRQLDIEADELRQAPEEEEEELALIYEAKGLSRDEAQALAKKLMADHAKSLETLAREELGINPQDLGGSAEVAAATSFALFSCGALVPLLPFLVSARPWTAWASLALSAAALFGIGAAITLVTGRSALRSGARQLALGVAAAAVTYGIGRLIGAGLPR